MYIYIGRARTRRGVLDISYDIYGTLNRKYFLVVR